MRFAIGPPSNAISPIIELVSNGLSSPHSKRAYERALTDFLRWCQASGAADFAKGTVQEYRSVLEAHALAASTINLRICAIRKMATELADNGALPQDVAAAIAKVKGAKRKGVRIGNWLSASQAEDLLLLPDAGSLKGQRDRALLGVLVGVGRRLRGSRSITFNYGTAGGSSLTWSASTAESDQSRCRVGLRQQLISGQRWHTVDPRKAEVIVLRFFGGLTVEETAEVLRISAQSVMRDWKMARAWLIAEVAK